MKSALYCHVFWFSYITMCNWRKIRCMKGFSFGLVIRYWNLSRMIHFNFSMPLFFLKTGLVVPEARAFRSLDRRELSLAGNWHLLFFSIYYKLLTVVLNLDHFKFNLLIDQSNPLTAKFLEPIKIFIDDVLPLLGRKNGRTTGGHSWQP